MSDYVAHAVVKSCATLHSDVHVFVDGQPTSNQTHRTLRGLQPSYESTHQGVHKRGFVGLCGLVQTPEEEFLYRRI